MYLNSQNNECKCNFSLTYSFLSQICIFYNSSHITNKDSHHIKTKSFNI